MPLPFTPILIAGATAAIGWFFQENSAKNARLRQNYDAELERRRQLREAELSRAQEIFNETCNAMDVLHYLLEDAAIHVAVRKAQEDTTREKEDGATWDKVEDATMNWMSHKTRFATQVRQYFGDDNHQLLNKIHESFKKAWFLLESTYYKGRESIVKEGKPNYPAYFGIIGSKNTGLERDIITLSEGMIRDIQNQNVGILRRK